MKKAEMEKVIQEQRERINELENRVPLSKSEVEKLIESKFHELELHTEMGSTDIDLRHNGFHICSAHLHLYVDSGRFN